MPLLRRYTLELLLRGLELDTSLFPRPPDGQSEANARRDLMTLLVVVIVASVLDTAELLVLLISALSARLMISPHGSHFGLLLERVAWPTRTSPSQP